MVDRKPVPTLVYRYRQHFISLTAVSATELADSVPGRDAVGGYNILRWADDRVAYWAISDIGVEDLNKFAQLFRSAESQQ